jgi:hypothetical protein
LQRIMSGDFCFCKNSFKLPITHWLLIYFHHEGHEEHEVFQ